MFQAETVRCESAPERHERESLLDVYMHALETVAAPSAKAA